MFVSSLQVVTATWMGPPEVCPDFFSALCKTVGRPTRKMGEKRCRSKRPFVQREKRAKRKRVWSGASPASIQSMQDDLTDNTAQLEAISQGKAVFFEYYRLQEICDSQEDLESLCNAMCRPLPVAFRVCGAYSRHDETEAALRPVLPLLRDFAPRRVAGVQVQPPTYFEWCRAWQLGCDDRVLKAELRAGDPDSDLSRLARWLNAANAAGVVARQEVRRAWFACGKGREWEARACRRLVCSPGRTASRKQRWRASKTFACTMCGEHRDSVDLPFLSHSAPFASDILPSPLAPSASS